MCSLYLGENLISGSKPINLGVRNIGEIVSSSLPLTDAGLHLLDGSLILGGGIYQGFVDYISNLYAENPSANYFCSESDWQASVTQYGVCGKFVYDSSLNSVRLPKVTGIIEGTTDVTALGDLVEAGLPNITGRIQNFSDQGVGSDSLSGAFYNGESKSKAAAAANTTAYVPLFDASRSSSIYGNSTTVQPQTIKAYYYIVIATSTKTDIQVDIDEITTDLNGKMDVDLSNMSASQSAKNEIISWGMPDYSLGISVTYPLSGNPFTAPSHGIFCAWGHPTANGIRPIINGVEQSYLRLGELANESGGYAGRSYLLSKNDVIYFSTSYHYLDGCTFFPLKGAN